MIKLEINNIKLKFKTDNNVFSPTYIDKGTLAMVSQVNFDENDRILDLGCGYGFVGIYVSKIVGQNNVVMSDISKESVELSRFNAELNNIKDISIIQSDCLDNIKENNFSLILTNPPYHVDFLVPKKFIEQGYKKLKVGGKMYMVTKRREWYKNKFISIFGGVEIVEIDGYYIFMAEKRRKNSKTKEKNINKLSKKLERKYSYKK